MERPACWSPTALQAILEDDLLRERLSKAGLAWARRFTWDRTADEVIEAMRETAKPGVQR